MAVRSAPSTARPSAARTARTAAARPAAPARSAGARAVVGGRGWPSSRSWLASNRSQVMYAGSRSRISTRHSSGRRISLPVVGRPGCLLPRVDRPVAEPVGPGVARVAQQVRQRRPVRPPPLQLARGSGRRLRPDRDADPVVDQVAEQAVQRAPRGRTGRRSAGRPPGPARPGRSPTRPRRAGRSRSAGRPNSSPRRALFSLPWYIRSLRT